MKASFILLVLCSLIFFLAPLYFYLHIGQNITNEISQQQCIGTILRMEQAQSCFMEVTVQQKDDSVKLSMCKCGSTDDFWNYAKQGDRLIKKKGELKVTIISKTTRAAREFKYPICLR